MLWRAVIVAGCAGILASVFTGCATSRESGERWMLREPRSEIDELIDQAQEIHRQGDILSADLLYRDLVERAPMNPRVLNNAAYFMIASGGNYNDAEALIRRALTLEPANPLYLDTLGYLLLESWRFSEAVEPLERAHARAGSLTRDEQRMIVLRLIMAYERTGQQHLARQVEAAYRVTDPDLPGSEASP